MCLVHLSKKLSCEGILVLLPLINNVRLGKKSSLVLVPDLQLKCTLGMPFHSQGFLGQGIPYACDHHLQKLV